MPVWVAADWPEFEEQQGISVAMKDTFSSNTKQYNINNLTTPGKVQDLMLKS
jgi:peptide subunit release factor RF-3